MIEIKLNKLLKKLDKNASEIAHETGINRNTINAIVNQKVEGFRFSTLDKICQTYNLRIGDIIELKYEKTLLAPRQHLYKQEAEMTPFSIWAGMIALSQISITEGGRTQYFGRMDAYFHKLYTVSYWDFDTMNQFAKLFYQKYERPADFDRYFSEYLVVALEIENLYDSLYGRSLSEITEEEFKQIYSLAKKAYIAFWLKSFVIETFDAGYDHVLIKKISQKYHFTEKETEVLTMPEQSNLDDERRLVLLSIAVNWIGKKIPLEKLIEKNREAVDAYKRKFDSYRSNYAKVVHISDDEIIKEAEGLLRNPKALRSDFKRLTVQGEKQKKNIKMILKKHHLKTNPLYYFNKLTYFREHRKTTNQKGFHVLDFILKYVEMKTGISMKYLKFLSFDEIEGVLKGLVSAKTLENRFEEGILVSINYSKPNEIKVFDDLEAKSIAGDLEREYLQKEVEGNVIKGFTASSGFAEGIARVITSQEDFGKFNEGEILVTSMTRSHFLPLMEKAKAIVTDEGGLSSHAVVVSRNLGKPCVIGTKIATATIKNGDTIEVRAGDGTVRILKK